METLPLELLHRTLIGLHPNDIINFCKTNKNLGRICNDVYFWASKAKLEGLASIEKFYRLLYITDYSASSLFKIIKSLKLFSYFLVNSAVIDDDAELLNVAFYRFEDEPSYSEPEYVHLQTAISKGNLHVIDILLDDDRLDPGVTNPISYTVTDTSLLARLLNDPRFRLDSNDEVLIEAVKVQNEDAVRLLLRDGRVDPTFRYNAAINKALERHNNQIIIMLLTDPRVNASDFLTKLINNNRPEPVSEILKYSFINPSNGGNELLFAAITRKHYYIIKQILAHPRFNISRENFNFMVKWAIINHDLDALKLLLSNDIIRGDLSSTLIISAAESTPEIMSYLLTETNLDPTVNDNEALKLATLYNKDEIVKLLWNDPRVRRSYGYIRKLRDFCYNVIDQSVQ